MKKINMNMFMLNTALILYLMVALVRVYFSNISSMLSVVFLMMSNILLIVNIISHRKIKKKSLFFVTICIIIFLPTLYNNAYLSDGLYNTFFTYFFTISFCILLYFCDIKQKNLKIVFNIVVTFSILTSIITWISFISPKFYINNIITLLPTSRQNAVIYDFSVSGMRMGLSDHYSRNAFYIMIGILIFIEKCLKKPEKKSHICMIIFLFSSLFLVGKRAHLLFLILSLILAYFVYNKVSIKNIFRFCGIAVLFLIIALLCIRFIPGTETIVNRLFNSSGDFTTGRSDLYKAAWDLYVSNNHTAIGWGQFAKSTDYKFVGVHNDYIQLFCETGIIGLLLVIISNFIILFKAIKYCKVKKNSLAFIILVYNIFFLIYSMTGIPHYDIEVYMMYFIFNTILFYLIEREKTNERTKN